MAERALIVANVIRARHALRLARMALRDVLVGASGTDAYGNYVAHLRRHHPELVPASREAFATEDLTARWNGVRRCC